MKLLQKTYNQEHLTRSEMRDLSDQIFEGSLTANQIAAFLMALKIKGETVEEMAGLAETIQAKAAPIVCHAANVMDNCGTGGDKSFSFNISTTAAFVLAAGGVNVAKHGNRSISSRSGSADVCEALGIDILLAPEKIGTVLQEIGIAFLFAPHMHPKMKYVMRVRQELATPTIMNLIGPLTNPVQLESQLLGTYRRDLLPQTAATLRELGRQRAVVVNGAGGMDEASLAGENHYALLEQGEISLHTFQPEAVGLPHVELAAIRGGDAAKNAEILLSVLKNRSSPYLDTVLLNAGLGFYANGKVASIEAGVQLARTVIASGAAYDKLNELKRMQMEVK